MGQCTEIGCTRDAVTTVKTDSPFMLHSPQSTTVSERDVCAKCASDIERQKAFC